jgi:hypothetical protein
LDEDRFVVGHDALLSAEQITQIAGQGEESAVRLAIVKTKTGAAALG